MISPVKIWRRQKEKRLILGKSGKIISWTKIYIAPKDFKNIAPYPVILVELEDKKKFVGQLVDYNEQNLKIGQKVKAILRKTRKISDEDVVPYGIKFKPI
jgi:hypothetical protein